MNPETGRFLTVDPFEGVNADPVTLHKYLYASANPVMYVDPSGESYSLAGMMADIGTIYALGSIAIPNFMKFLVKAEGQTDTFTVQFFSGGSLGKGFYGGAIDAYIWEEQPSNPKLHIQAKRQLFTVILVGYGYGWGLTLAEFEHTFPTKGNRKLLSFAGYGRISSAVEVGYKGFGSISYSELQFPEGTWIEPKISFKPGVTRGFSVYLCAAVFIPVGPQDNVP